jgi:hypothetical protein
VNRVEGKWLAVEPLDLRVGTEAALARVVVAFGSDRPHHAYCRLVGRKNAPTRQTRRYFVGFTGGVAISNGDWGADTQQREEQ